MDTISFIFWEVIEVAGLALMGLVAVKALARVGRPKKGSEQGKNRKLIALRRALYVVVLMLVSLGARVLGRDWAAEIYSWAAEDNLARSQVAKALDNAQQAVNIRPREITYWRLLERARIRKGDYASVLRDEATIRSLSGGDLPEEDTIRLVVCHYGLGHYDQVVELTERMIQKNRFYLAPYVLQGSAYTAEKKYGEAEKRFLEALQILPTQVDAVSGLAQAYFLAGEKGRALAVLKETEKFPFAPEARKHFEELKARYAQ